MGTKADPTFAAIAPLLERATRDTFHRRVTETSYEIRHDISDPDDRDGDFDYMVPFAHLESRGAKGTKLTFYPLLSYKRLRAKVTPALAAHQLGNRKSFVFEERITAAELRDLAAMIALGAKIWYVEVAD
jgi:hypothetical protein